MVPGGTVTTVVAAQVQVKPQVREGSMQRVGQRRYGSPDVFELQTAAPPAIGDDGILVRVLASCVNAYDWHMLRGKPYLMRLSEGFRRPKSQTTGVDVAGVVEAVGRSVTGLKPGDAVFGARSGAFAEYVAGREGNFVLKPPNLTFEAAAAIPTAAVTALQAIRDKAGVKAGQRVLVTGAGGGVGTFAVQIAKAFGADVTATTSPGNLDLVASIGADRVIDYTQVDVTRAGDRYDAVIDVAGTLPLWAMGRLLAPGGTVVIVGGPAGDWIGPLRRFAEASILTKLGRGRFTWLLAKHNLADLEALAGLAASGAIRPVIDRTYPLREVAAAVRYVETGQARGKVVITISGTGNGAGA